MLSGVFASLGRFVYRRQVPVVLAWVLVLGVGLGVGGEVFGRLGTGSGLRDDAESVVVSDLVRRVSGAGTEITGLIDGRRADDPAFRAEVADARRDLEAIPGVQRVIGPWTAGREVPGLVAEDRDQAQEDLERGETLALPVMLVLRFLVFRGVVAALTPCWSRWWRWPGRC
jgi:uncharacterized membrane protein YdfJ with MMPL/SSD domain